MENKYMVLSENINKEKKYFRFRNIYIPTAEKKVILSSLILNNSNSRKIRIYQKIGNLITRTLNIKILNMIGYKKTHCVYKNIIINKKIEDEFKLVKNYSCCAIYLGIENITKKYVFQLMDKRGNILGYGKSAKNIDEENTIFREIENLNYLQQLDFKCGKVPKVIYFNKENNVYMQSTEENLKKSSNKINKKHIDFLVELYDKTNEIHEFKKTKFYDHFINIKSKSSNKLVLEISKRALEKMDINKIKCCYGHGDFYHQNVKLYKDIIYVYDWDHGGVKPLYYDLYHYILNEDIVSNKIKKETLIKKVLGKNKMLDYFEDKLQINSINRVQMLILYLHEVIYEFAITINVDIKKDDTLINYINMLDVLLESI